ncbi:MAG: 4Fe-4S binding protein [Clostridium sp.]|nr:4Fe-4S binding protein [Clostridium sp.]
MKKITMIYFSPTGTSARVASAIVKGLNAGGQAEVSRVDITRQDAPEQVFDAETVVVIAAPVYGGHLPRIAAERMQALRGQDTPAVLVAVYGNRAFEHALTDLEAFAVERGFVPVAVGAFVGEHSYSTLRTPIAVGRPDADDLAVAIRLGEEVRSKLQRSVCRPVDASALTDEPAAPESMANFRAFVAGYQQRQAVQRQVIVPQVRSRTCIHCSRCAVLCPVRAIPVGDEEHTDASRCIKCCACVKRCPVKARTLDSPFAPVLADNFGTRRRPQYLL